MQPWATGTVYVNFSERGGSAANAYPAATYERLRDLRARGTAASDSSEVTASSRGRRRGTAGPT